VNLRYPKKRLAFEISPRLGFTALSLD